MSVTRGDASNPGRHRRTSRQVQTRVRSTAEADGPPRSSANRLLSGSRPGRRRPFETITETYADLHLVGVHRRLSEVATRARRRTRRKFARRWPRHEVACESADRWLRIGGGASANRRSTARSCSGIWRRCGGWRWSASKGSAQDSVGRPGHVAAYGATSPMLVSHSVRVRFRPATSQAATSHLAGSRLHTSTPSGPSTASFVPSSESTAWLAATS